MKDIFNRLKSPIVILQLISILETYMIAMSPDLSGKFKATATMLASVVNILAGLNNPTDKDNF
ncbi:MAG: hypothetical protein MJ224_01630 [archaeon]|nr:hypothetical protein [archaeon]